MLRSFVKLKGQIIGLHQIVVESLNTLFWKWIVFQRVSSKHHNLTNLFQNCLIKCGSMLRKANPWSIYDYQMCLTTGFSWVQSLTNLPWICFKCHLRSEAFAPARVLCCFDLCWVAVTVKHEKSEKTIWFNSELKFLHSLFLWQFDP